MTPRQRVLSALNHQPPDRVPIDFGGHRSSGIAAIAYGKLRTALHLPPRPVRVYDPVQQLAIIDEDVLDRFGADTIELGRGFALEDCDWADWVLPDGSPCQMPAWALPEREPGGWVMRSKTSGRALAKMPDGALYFEQCFWPYLEHDDLDRLSEALAENMWCGVRSPPGPLVAGPDGPRRLAEGAKALRADREGDPRPLRRQPAGDRPVPLPQRQLPHAPGRRPGRAGEFLERLVEIHMVNLEKFLSAVGPYIDIIVFGDDLGMQSGPQMSRNMYRELFMPRHARMWRRAKELANVKVMLHSCGGIRPLLPDLIEAGLDAVNPVQISCAGMEAAGLKADFGAAVTFWGGGCDTRFVLASARPEEIRRHVGRQVEVLNRRGGFVFQQVHNILADVPPENVIAMFDALA